MTAALSIISEILKATEPYPALAVDRHWNLLAANSSLDLLLSGVAPHLLEPPVNVLRLSLHPDGLSRRILNFGAWRTHILARLAHDIVQRFDPQLIKLHAELTSYALPAGRGHRPAVQASRGALAIPLEIDSAAGPLSFLGTTTVFGTAEDITLAGIVIECLYPANPQTADLLRRMSQPIR